MDHRMEIKMNNRSEYTLDEAIQVASEFLPNQNFRKKIISFMKKSKNLFR